MAGVDWRKENIKINDLVSVIRFRLEDHIRDDYEKPYLDIN